MNIDLNRFVEAQQRDFEVALAEVKNGRKVSHWMWYIFPQIRGLGYSETAKFYGIQNLQEAKEYLNHPVLGWRMIEICKALLQLQQTNAKLIFGHPDDLKLKSSMTLYGALDSHPIFQQVLDKYFNGEKDHNTLEIIKNGE